MSEIESQDSPGIAQWLRETCHDMRQPVAGVLALAGAVLAAPELSIAARRRLEQIVEQAEWLADMIQHGLLCESGEAAPQQSDAIRIASEAAAAERLTWPGEINLVRPAEPVRIAVHPLALRRIVANLLSNATRAAGPAGMVMIEVGSHGGLALLMVDDSGPGFGQIQAGLGLGLPAVARSVIKYGGRLECGRGPLGGARVKLLLPLAPSQPPGTRQRDSFGLTQSPPRTPACWQEAATGVGDDAASC